MERDGVASKRKAEDRAREGGKPGDEGVEGEGEGAVDEEERDEEKEHEPGARALLHGGAIVFLDETHVADVGFQAS